MLKRISVIGTTLNKSELRTVNGGNRTTECRHDPDCEEKNGNPDNDVSNRYQ